MILSEDSQAILLLCSHLALPPSESKESEESEKKGPLDLREWNKLAGKLKSLSLRPADLLEMDADQLKPLLAATQLKLSDEEDNKEELKQQPNRIWWLLQRKGTLAIELERLESLGIHAMTRADDDYPKRYKERLREKAPVFLFYAGEKALLGQPGVAVVGSRHLDKAGRDFAERIGGACAQLGKVLYSGGAKGVDTVSMKAALDARGCAVGILAGSLEEAVRNREYRTALQRGDLCLATPYSPNARFSVGFAMGRNKLIYALADYAIVVASDAGKGGTWAGAIEALKAKWVPVFVLNYPQMPEGNKQLITKEGAKSCPNDLPADLRRLIQPFESHLYPEQPQSSSQPGQENLFNNHIN